MTRRRSTVVVLNYHRVPPVPEPGPAHALHTVSADVFERQIERCHELGSFATLDQVVEYAHLDERSFLVTFDDVPTVTFGAMQLLRERDVPYAVSVCALLANEGHGWRDKVYAITRHAARDRVLEKVSELLDGAPSDDQAFSFYEFTKSTPLHPERILHELVEPLFDELPAEVRASLSERKYADWQAVATLGRDPLTSLSNHGWSHVSFDGLSGEERRSDVLRAHTAIEAATGLRPRHFTVPFGYVTQELLLDLTAFLRELDYRTVLWTEGYANLVVEPYLGRDLIHLLRIDAAPTMDGFEAQLRDALGRPLYGPAELLPRSQHRGEVSLAEASDQEQAAVLETILRPGKDYAASRVFYDYAFTSNPFRNSRPDYVVASSRTRPEAIAYRFGARFTVGDAQVDGIYVAGWRRLPVAARLAGTAVFRRLVSGVPVVGAYKPSAESEAAFSTWTAVEVFEHTISLTDDMPEGPLGTTHRVEQLDSYPPALDELARNATVGRFTVTRGASLYRWRIDRYPLASSATYVILLEDDQPVAYAVLLVLRDAAAVTDFVAFDPRGFIALIEATFAVARCAGAATATLETSSRVFSRELTQRWASRCGAFRNYYRIADELRGRLPDHACRDGIWDAQFVHETQITGDVLLR